MIKLIMILLVGIFILKNMANIITLITQLIVVWIGFTIHPFLGIFLLIAYIADWLGITKEKNNKNNERHNNYFDDSHYNEQKKEDNKQQERPRQQQKTNGFFSGCVTKEQLKKKHRELCKIYHPDKGGDIEIFKKMQAEYETLIMKFK